MSGNLKQHLIWHGGVKFYVCSHCPKCLCTEHELNLISRYTQIINSFAVVCVVKILKTNITLCSTLRDVL